MNIASPSQQRREFIEQIADRMEAKELDARLQAWAKEYGGGRYENNGWKGRNLLQTLHDHGGFVPDPGGFHRPPIRTAADEIEDAVQRMERGGWFKQGRVLRCDYFEPNMAIQARLDALRRLGIGVSKAGYYAYLAQAKAFVAGAMKDGYCV